MAVVSPVQTEDLVGVRSRISWGAIIAGSVLAISVYFLLSLLGGAVGFSIRGSTDPKTLTISAIVWAIVSTAMSLFIGGYIASLLTVGENKNEAALYGLLVWAVVFTMLMWLMVSGVKTGFNALVSVTTMGTSIADATARNSTQADWEEGNRSPRRVRSEAD